MRASIFEGVGDAHRDCVKGDGQFTFVDGIGEFERELT